MKHFQYLLIILVGLSAFAQNGQVVNSPANPSSGNGGTNFTPAGDLSGNANTQMVVGIKGVPLDNSAATPNPGDVLQYDPSLAKYAPNSIPLVAIPQPTNTLVSGGGVVWKGGLNFTMGAAQYTIGGVTYSSPQTDATLATADATNPRIDVFVVTNSGTAIVLTGTPNANPVKPTVDPTSEVELSFILVPAGATQPTVNDNDIYLENTEWTTAVTSNVNAASTNNPYQGTKDVEFTTAVAGNYVTFTYGGSFSLNQFQFLSFYIRNKAGWPNAKSLSIVWQNGSVNVGAAIGFKNGVYGFVQTNTTTYQQIVIPISAFATGGNVVNKLKIQVLGGSSVIGFYIDDIQLQDVATNVTTGQSLPTSIPNGAILTAHPKGAPYGSTDLYWDDTNTIFRMDDGTSSICTILSIPCQDIFTEGTNNNISDPGDGGAATDQDYELHMIGKGNKAVNLGVGYFVGENNHALATGLSPYNFDHQYFLGDGNVVSVSGSGASAAENTFLGYALTLNDTNGHYVGGNYFLGHDISVTASTSDVTDSLFLGHSFSLTDPTDDAVFMGIRRLGFAVHDYYTKLEPSAFSHVPACSSAMEGSEQAFTDSTTNTWGATITGGGSLHVKGYCDGTNWTVEAK